jgi:deoxyribose-phosphate aldolase
MPITKNYNKTKMNFPPLPLKKDLLGELVRAISASADRLFVSETVRFIFSCIDLTTLNSYETPAEVAEFTRNVNSFPEKFPDIPNVAAICVYPNMVSVVRENLAATGVSVCSVAGGFPSSMTFRSLKEEEARLAVIAGADEVDIVMPLWAFREGSHEYCLGEIAAVSRAIGDTRLKVILESGVLGDPVAIWEASLISLQAGAHFIKTSTGKMPVSATPEAAVIMCHSLRYWYESTGEKRGFKAAGGIVTPSDAILYMAIVKEILGDEWLTPELFRIGASRLANNLLSAYFGRETSHF